jgi:hypothetical protein
VLVGPDGIRRPVDRSDRIGFLADYSEATFLNQAGKAEAGQLLLQL